MKVKELIDIVQEGHYLSLEAFEDDNDIYHDCVKYGCHVIVEEYDTIATHIYKCEDGYVGVTGVYSCSDAATYEDLENYCVAEEFKEVTIIDYVPVTREEC